MEWISFERRNKEKKIKVDVVESGLKALSLDPKTKQARTKIKLRLSGVAKKSYTFNNTENVLFDVPSSSFTTETGAPKLPVKGLLIAIPYNAIRVKTSIIKVEYYQPKENMLILPVFKEYTNENFEEISEYYINKKVYDMDCLYPNKIIEEKEAIFINGIHVAHVLLYLSQYNPVKREIKIIKDIEFDVEYSIDNTIKSPIKHYPKPVCEIIDINNVQSIFLDITKPNINENMKPEIIFNFFYINKKRFDESDITCKYLILTTEDLKEYTTDLAWANLDLHPRIVTLEDVYSYYESKLSRKTWNSLSYKQIIKLFIKHVYNNWNNGEPLLYYVVFIGDRDKFNQKMIFPLHYYGYEFTEEGEGLSDSAVRFYPSDHYYSTNLDYDNDFNKGEAIPQIVISRIPISDNVLLKKVCQNMRDARSTIKSDFRKNFLFAAYYNTNSTPFTSDDETAYSDCLDDIIASINQSSNGANIIKRYGSGYQATGYSSKDIVNVINDTPVFTNPGNINNRVEAIVRGAGIVNYRGHGSINCWSSSISINTAMVRGITSNKDTNLSNFSKMSFFLNICCANAWLDNDQIEQYTAIRIGEQTQTPTPTVCQQLDSLAESQVKESKAIASIGATRVSNTTPNNQYNRKLWESIIYLENPTPGTVFNKAKIDYWSSQSDEEKDKNYDIIVHIWIYMLFGDPAFPLWKPDPTIVD